MLLGRPHRQTASRIARSLVAFALHLCVGFMDAMAEPWLRIEGEPIRRVTRTEAEPGGQITLIATHENPSETLIWNYEGVREDSLSGEEVTFTLTVPSDFIGLHRSTVSVRDSTGLEASLLMEQDVGSGNWLAVEGATESGSWLYAIGHDQRIWPGQYQWQRGLKENGPFTDIDGATSRSYRLSSVDVGHYVRVVRSRSGSRRASPSYPIYKPGPGSICRKEGEVWHDRSVLPRTLTDMRALDDGSVYLAGEIMLTAGRVAHVVRLNPSGAFDPTFSPPTLQPSQPWSGRLIKPLPDGRLVFVGEFESINGHPFRNAAVLHPDGTVDESSFLGPLSQEESIVDAAPLADGRFYVAFRRGSGDESILHVKRYDQDGNRDQFSAQMEQDWIC